ncbi:cytochrome P450 [Calocera cornea HHB12733]|uniref:Cytochrome P450 n=1 Tax=Calocera cornea HHB12733 TaxID=1353952 RepID=A0A165DKV5_9BASI|nr:cytochrome P450 [Calocera cornea HHB12733]
MPGLLLIAAPVLIAALFATWYLKVRVSPRRDAPPMVPYIIPWIGSSINMATDPDAFFANATAKHGNIVGVQAVGTYRYFVTHPTLAKQVHKMSKQFVFTPYRLHLSMKVFGMKKSTIEETGFFEDSFFETLHRLMAPNEISKNLVPTYAKYAAQEVAAYVPPPTPVTARDLLYKMLFRASAYAFFGGNFDADSCIDDFIAFDKALPLIMLDVPWPLTIPGQQAHEAIMKHMRNYVEKTNASGGDYVEYMTNHAREYHVEHEIPALCLTLLWALEANAPLAAYWAVVLSLVHKNGLAPLVTEIDTARAAWESTNPGLSVAKNPDYFVAQANLPLLLATIQETLRYATSSFSIRRVMEPTTFAGYNFHVGEELVINGRSSQTDDEYYPDPEAFEPSRFLHAGSTTLPTGKEKLINTTAYTAPFGGGVSMCEGRHFAQTELKIFIVLLLTQLDISLAPGAKPEDAAMDSTRIGLGVIHPKRDVMLIVKRRSE